MLRFGLRDGGRVLAVAAREGVGGEPVQEGAPQYGQNHDGHEKGARLETVLLELEERPEDGRLIARAFRALHTIKGNGAMFGFSEIERFSHELERIFDVLRNHEAKADKELIDLTLMARDHTLW